MLYDELIIIKKKKILSIFKKYGAYNIRIFGSVARGEENQKSDIDFLVNFEKGKGLINHLSLIIELEKMLNRSVDVVNEKGLKERLKDQILEEAIPL